MADNPTTKLNAVLRFALGADNLAPETGLADGAMREVVNVDVFLPGSVRSRPGLRLVEAGAFAALHRPTHGRFLLATRDADLVRVSGSDIVALVPGVRADRIAFADLDGETYWVDGLRRGRVTATGDSALWGLATPPSIAVAPTTSGGLVAGPYQVAMTALVGGLESGASRPVSVTVPDGGGIAVTVPTGATFAVYRTPPNGTAGELSLAATVSSGGQSTLGSGQLGRPLRSLHASPPDAGTAIAAYRGRLFVASGDVIRFSSALSRHWFFRETGYYRVGGAVTMLGATENGLYVGTGSGVWFFGGADGADLSARQVSSVGSASAAIPIAVDAFAAQGRVPGLQCAWVDVDGFLCVGRPGGIIERPTRSRYCMGSVRGATLAEVHRVGLRQIVIGLDDRAAGPFAQTDAAVEAEYPHGATFG